MTAIDSAEVINELEAECSCAREVLAAMQAQRDSARDLAAHLEAIVERVQAFHRPRLWGRDKTWMEETRCSCGVPNPDDEDSDVQWLDCETVRLVYTDEEIDLATWLDVELREIRLATYREAERTRVQRDLLAAGWTPPLSGGEG